MSTNSKTRIKNDSIKGRLLRYILDNSGISASPMAIAKELELDCQPPTVYCYIKDLKDQGYIKEIKGRYYS